MNHLLVDPHDLALVVKGLPDMLLSHDMVAQSVHIPKVTVNILHLPLISVFHPTLVEG